MPAYRGRVISLCIPTRSRSSNRKTSLFYLDREPQTTDINTLIGDGEDPVANKKESKCLNLF